MDGQTPTPPNVSQTEQTPVGNSASSPLSANETPEAKKATSTPGKAAEPSLQRVG